MTGPDDKKGELGDAPPPSRRVSDGRPMRQSLKNPEYSQSPERLAELVRAISNEPSQARPSSWGPEDARGVTTRSVDAIESDSPRANGDSPGPSPTVSSLSAESRGEPLPRRASPPSSHEDEPSPHERAHGPRRLWPLAGLVAIAITVLVVLALLRLRGDGSAAVGPVVLNAAPTQVAPARTSAAAPSMRAAPDPIPAAPAVPSPARPPPSMTASAIVPPPPGSVGARSKPPSPLQHTFE